MVQTPEILHTQSRAIDPDVLQRQAANPIDSVWVGASAGSGKTKVLTDRMLRLLLPDAQGNLGTKPHKILALTFTKAAASEMALRITKNLSAWAVMPMEGEKGLFENLKKLLGNAPTDLQIQSARKLFAAVIDAPGGLKIMTLHSFCQSVLSRFPLEADLTPNFKALEESDASALLKQAIHAVLKLSQNQKGSPLSEALHNLASNQNEEQFLSLLRNLLSEQRQMVEILSKNFGVEGLYTALCQYFNIPAGQSPESLIHAACEEGAYNESDLRTACKALSTGTPATDQKKAQALQHWLECDLADRIKIYPEYKLVFLTNDNTLRKALATKKVKDNFPEVEDILLTEATRLFNLEKNMKAAEIAMLTRDLFHIGQEVLTAYATLKSKQGALDFDDLILKTLDLLKGNTKTLNGLNATPWVRFKMDQGIDHILVDEAQDTNPEQWGIIQALCDDFFDGQNEGEIERSIFIVGDEKQSIFSFQRASPEKFTAMRHWFSDKIKNTQKELKPVDFITSFRSVPAILDFVDSVFAGDEMRQGLGDAAVEHKSFRYTQAGQVELWPLFENADKIEHDPWAPPTEIINATSGAAQLAEHIGNTIQGWIENKEILESYDRPIHAGDIMILVRSRTAFLDQIVRALKTRNIAVSGVDRMVLSQQLVVQDLCALAQFALLPEDDLTLATILKSPFIGWDEENLYKIAYKRQGSLWADLKASGEDITWLSNLIEKVGATRPYDFFSSILQSACPADPISGLRAIKKRLGEECLDPLNEFLNSALHYEQGNIPSLQDFIQKQLYDDSQIKRQMEEAGKAVRIMTVHGAKGLQAPIVILPDTTRTASSNKSERIFWPEKTGLELPFFCPTSDSLPAPCVQAKEILQQRENEEYKRLLYVALTRAEHRLYIGGHKATKSVIEESWYKYIERGFSTLKDVQHIDFAGDEDKKILRFANPATDKPDRVEQAKFSENNTRTSPAWLFKAMPQEPFPPRPLMPSRPSEPEMPSLSPLQSSQNDRFKRGNITHKLLQLLPDLVPLLRQAAAERYVSQPSHALSKDLQQGIVSEVMAILNHPDYAPIFGKGSLAEAPITGLIHGNRLISGQIDRLLVTPTQILIIDYKSNRPPPQDIENVPLIYKNQMQAYADVMREIYPNRTIKCALIWTDGCRLMEIPIK